MTDDGARGGAARIWASLRALAGRPFESLPSRIIISVYAAALVTSLLVTGIATKSTESFLRAKIEERFPELLARTSERLDVWYAQRELDIGTFASSEIVMESLVDAADVDSTVRREARRYLTYVRESFPQYASLFVLDAQGSDLVGVGARPSMSAFHREAISALREPRVGPVRGEGAARYQIFSSPVTRDGHFLGTFHAVVGMGSVEALLRADDFEATTGVYVVGPERRVLARSPGAPARATYSRALPIAGVAPAIADYTDASGERLIGTAVPFARFDWSLVVEESYDVAFAPVVAVYRRVLAINIAIVLVFGLVAYAIARSIVRPILALSDGARRIASGATDVEIPASRSSDEIGVLSRALNQMIDRLQRNRVELERRQVQIERANDELRDMNVELRRSNELLEQLSFTDGLTRLHNHRYFQDRIKLEVKRCERSGESLALVLLDIDEFKSLNDRFGHAVGDEVLRRVADVINDNVRETDLPARYGGEEFAVLAPATPGEGALALAEKLRGAVSRARVRSEGIEGEEMLSVTVSVGVAVYRGDRGDLFNDADRALYEAKGSGKDCVVMAGA